MWISRCVSSAAHAASPGPQRSVTGTQPESDALQVRPRMASRRPSRRPPPPTVDDPADDERARGADRDLSDLPLADLLGWVGTGQPARRRRAVGRRGRASIVLVDGRIALASADDGPDARPDGHRLGAPSAPRAGTPAHGRRRCGRDLADALVDGGADDELLVGALREQTVGALFEFLVPGETAFAYLPGATHAARRAASRFEPGRRHRRGPARVDAWKVIAEAIPSTSVVMRLTRQLDAPTISITAEDWRILALVDGRLERRRHHPRASA